MSEQEPQDSAYESFREEALESGHEEVIENKRRGCGHLQNNSAYVRSDVEYLATPEGEVPAFVALDDPVEYREYSGSGAIIPGWRKFPGVEFSIAYERGGRTTTPENEVVAHLSRLIDGLGFDGTHYGEITAARSHDILMSVGKTHWSEPEDYIEECRTQGLNLKIPSGPASELPVVNPMITRCWVVHPNGVAEGRAGIIGWGVLTRVVYTVGEDATDDDPDVPAYAQDWADTGKVNLVTPGEEVDPDKEDEEEPGADLDEFKGGEGDDGG